MKYKANKLAVVSSLAICLGLTACQSVGTNTVAPNQGVATASPQMQANFNAVAQIAAQGNAFAVNARLVPGDTVKVGESMVLQVQSAKAGRVWVVAVDAADKVNVLFPNSAYRDNAIKADTPVRIPPDGASGRLIAAEPRGDARLLVLMTAPDQTLDEVISTSPLRITAKPDNRSWAAGMVAVKIN